MHVPVNRVFNNVSRNLGLQTYVNNLDSWSEWAFEAEQYIGSNKTFLQKEIVYSATPAQATAQFSLEVDNTNLDKEYVEINGVRFIFRNTASANFIGSTTDSFEVAISTVAALSNSLTAFCNKFNDSFYEKIQGITASNDGDKTITLTVNDDGNFGNDYTIETSNGIKVAKFFTGGKDILNNKQIRLPDSYVKVLSVRAGDAIIQPTSSQYKSKVSTLLDRFYINGNRINFTADYTSDVVVTILSVPLSVEGYPMILQGHEEAVAHYIMWKHKLIGYYAGEVPQYIVKDLERRWYQLCGKARGDDNMPTSIELLKIGKLWNTKIPLTSFNPPLYDGLNSY